MKMIAVVFSHAPHGNSLGREGLDLILGISVLIKKISVFFIGDGIFQLFKGDNVDNILSRNYIPTFSLLPLLHVNNFYCCKMSLLDRGRYDNLNYILNIKILKPNLLRVKLDCHDAIINF